MGREIITEYKLFLRETGEKIKKLCFEKIISVNCQTINKIND